LTKTKRKNQTSVLHVKNIELIQKENKMRGFSKQTTKEGYGKGENASASGASHVQSILTDSVTQA
jgi:hypothetical protein